MQFIFLSSFPWLTKPKHWTPELQRQLAVKRGNRMLVNFSHWSRPLASTAKFGIMLCVFELCRLPQRPSLTLHPLGGSTPRLWPLFLLRAKGKRKEMTGTQHVGTLKHKFLQYIKIKNVLVLFYYQNNFEMNSSSVIWWRHDIYR
jgi:hypothetical protein